MADRYLLESAIPIIAPDGYLLEDGTGVLLLEDGGVTGRIFVLAGEGGGLAGPRRGLAG